MKLPLNSHIWVSASAGTGKTTILTNRVLQLLLSGANPATILCLTYTNAAAAEMEERITTRLGNWVIADAEELEQDISRLVEEVNDEVMQRARSLFFTVTEQPDSLNIQTIHSFCQSILRRFPLEAGVSPYFTVMSEEQSQTIMEQSLESLLLDMQFLNMEREEWARVQVHSQILMRHISEYSFREFIRDSIRDNARWRKFMGQVGGISACEKQLKELLGIQGGEVAEGKLDSARKKRLSQLASYFSEQKQKTLQSLGNEIELFLEDGFNVKEVFERYSSAWLTKDNSIKSIIAKQCDANTEIASLIRQESEQVLNEYFQRAHNESYMLTYNLYTMLHAIFERYETTCQEQGLLDYHHLLQKTSEFLSSDEHALGWVMFKLDAGIDHILVDEAQDTNLLQWDIIKAISTEYFSGQGRKEVSRTLFVVGDEKQSIFSFQDADVGVYRSIRKWMQSSANAAGQPFEEIDLLKSYRSTPEVISTVNEVVSSLNLGKEHVANRQNEKGSVTLWPLVSAGDSEEESLNAEEMLVSQIADEIEQWLKNGKKIATTNRPVQAGDIMVLVRRRSALSVQLAAELRHRHIAVQGVERMVLGESLAVQDITALMQWALLPEDDYSLACVLRSPIIGLSDEQLFKLSHDRGEQSLWQSLEENAEQSGLVQEYSSLKRYLSDIYSQTVHAFVYQLLYSESLQDKFIQRFGPDVSITLHALLEKAQQFEQQYPKNFHLFIEQIHKQQHEMTSKESVQNCVRIMTIHGSKGLEAPIVILADTTNTVRSTSGFSWVMKDGQQVPCWLPVKKSRMEGLSNAVTATEQLADEEDKRLLYVALTRARDELYITGPEPTRSQKCHWHQLLSETLESSAIRKDFTNRGASQTLDEAV